MTLVLFVDDEPRVLNGLRRQHHALRDEWSMRFAAGGREALGCLADEPVDVLVTDLCMPGMDGAELLGRVAEASPWTVRLALSGHADPVRLGMALARAHRCLEKPCPPGDLEREIRLALAAREVAARGAPPVLAALWRTPPDRVPAAQPLLPLMHGPRQADDAIDVLRAALASDARLRSRLAVVLQAVCPGSAPGPDAGPDALVSIGARVVAPLVVSLRLFEAFCVPYRSWEDGLANACRAAERAHALGPGPASAADAAGAAAGALLLPETASAAAASTLAYLLPIWGLPGGTPADAGDAPGPSCPPSWTAEPLAPVRRDRPQL